MAAHIMNGKVEIRSSYCRLTQEEMDSKDDQKKRDEFDLKIEATLGAVTNEEDLNDTVS